MSSMWSDLMKAQETQTTALPVNARLQRKCDCGQHTVAGGECNECSEKRLQRRSANQTQTPEVPPIVHDVLRSPGQPLDAETRAFMEPRFKHDFSRVRLHVDEKAAESARSVNALAYTSGWNVVLGQGQYNPTTPQGRQLLAHELTHVVQQRGDSFHQKMEIGRPHDIYERQADEMAREVMQAPEATSLNRAGSLSQPQSSFISRLHQDFGGVLRRQHTDTTATQTDPQDTTGTAKRVRESQCPDKFRCTQPYKDRQVCCNDNCTKTAAPGFKTCWVCIREKVKGQFSMTQHDTSDAARKVCSG